MHVKGMLVSGKIIYFPIIIQCTRFSFTLAIYELNSIRNRAY